MKKSLLKKIKSFIFVFLLNIYRNILLKTDKKLFAILFNIKSRLILSRSRLKWDGYAFYVSDSSLPGVQYRIRHQRQCNLVYEYGLAQRANSIGESYFLDRIDFNDYDLVIDCGANVGDLRLWFLARNININYMGFEPSPVEFTSLVHNVSECNAYNYGLWKSEGSLNFFVSSQGADSSLIEPKNYDEVISVKVVRLDSFVNQRVKLLKLEAEGAEPEILIGLGDKLNLVDYIAADLGYERGVNSESTFVPVVNYLLSRGFELIDVSHGRICALFKNSAIK